MSTPLQPPPLPQPPLDGRPELFARIWATFFQTLFTYVIRAQIRLTFTNTGYVATPNQLVLVDATAGATTIKLPPGPDNGNVIIVKKIDASANAVTIDGNGSFIDGLATQPLAAQWNSKTVQGNGDAWFITAAV